MCRDVQRRCYREGSSQDNPIYVDNHGNIKLYFEGSTDTCNIFMEDPTLEIPLTSLKYLYYKRGVRSAIVSKAGKRGFEKTEVFELADRIHAGKDVPQSKDNFAMWVTIVIIILVMIGLGAFYISYVTNTVGNKYYGVKENKVGLFGGDIRVDESRLR